MLSRIKGWLRKAGLRALEYACIAWKKLISEKKITKDIQQRNKMQYILTTNGNENRKTIAFPHLILWGHIFVILLRINQKLLLLKFVHN